MYAELQEEEEMRRHMRRAWELARDNAAAGGVENACVIVDPRTGGAALK